MYDLLVITYTLLLLCYISMAAKIQCTSNNLLDVTAYSRQLYDMRKMLGGHTDVDLWFPQFKYGSPFGQFKISNVCDLECFDFDAFLTKPCRWRNEVNGCVGDDLDFLRMRGSWDPQEGGLLFGKNDAPDGFFLLVGTDKKKWPWKSAMLVSDPIQCQEGDGLVTFKHWTSPGIKVKVCIRHHSRGRQMDWCSEPVSRNGTKPASVVIPGSITYTFEIVIEVSNFVLDILGKEGGVAVLDDISYNASAIYNCKQIPHRERLPSIDTETCLAIQCNFDYGKCLKSLKSSGWSTKTRKEITSLDGKYAHVDGPGTYVFTLGPLTLPRFFGLEFCFFAAGPNGYLQVDLVEEDDTKRSIYRSTDSNRPAKEWICDKVMIANGTYQYIEFSAQKLHDDEILAMDQIALVDPMTGGGACEMTKRYNYDMLLINKQ